MEQSIPGTCSLFALAQRQSEKNMGLCGCKLAADNQDLGSVPVTIVQAGMGVVLQQMQNSSMDVTVTVLVDPDVPPYSVEAGDYNSTKDVTVQGGYSGRFIGVNQISDIGENNFLVSDSFTPCVPVIIFSKENAWLLHANGTGGVLEIERVASKDNHDIYIISRKHARSAQVARAIFDLLSSDYSAQIIDVKVGGMIGVVVSASSKTILVYRQKGS